MSPSRVCLHVPVPVCWPLLNLSSSTLSELGMALTGLGMLFTFFGVMLFFDSGLLSVGNVRPGP